MIGDGVNDVPALKQARVAVAMGSGSQISKGVADVVLLKDQFSMLPRAVHEGRRIARNIHRLARLYLTKSVYAGFLILAAAVLGFTFPFLPRHLTVAAFLTIGIPSFVLALAPSEGSLLSFFLVDTVFGGSLSEGRTAATTTLIVLGLAFILLLERGPGREHIAIQSYMLALVAGLGALYALALAAAPVRDFFDLELLSAGQWFLSMLSVVAGLVLASALWRLPQIQRLEEPEGGRSEAPTEEAAPGPTHTPATAEQPGP
jgi:magnesium-transporting ATPase (P-type)